MVSINSMDIRLLTTGLTALIAQIGLGGGIYEYIVLDPVWPLNLVLIQPQRGGVKRVRFWLPAHIAFELILIATLVLTWKEIHIRTWLVVAFAAHAIMRIWSAFDFIPKAIAFEKLEPDQFDPASAQAWTRRSLGRLPLALLTSIATMVAFYWACRNQ
jgi:hypothetical protein